MKKAVFISTDILRSGEPKTSLAMGYILSALKANSFLKDNLDISHIPLDCSSSDVHPILTRLSSELEKEMISQVDFVAVSAYIWGEYLLKDIVSLLKQQGFRGKIILGGYQITYSHKDELLNIYPFADVFISSYGEKSLQKFFMQAIQGAVSYPSFYQEPVDFNFLPSPYLSREIIVPTNTHMLRWETKRGCCFSCSFCAHRDLSGQVICHHSTDKVFQELEFICQKEVNKVNIIDPIFNIGKNYLSIMEHINQQSGDTKFSIQTRFESMTDPFFDLLSSKKFILELGLQTIHSEEDSIIGRRNNMAIVKSRLKQLVDNNINIEVSMIYGLPSQTYESFCQGIEFLQDIGCTNIIAFPLMIYRGTKLYQEKELYGLQEEKFPEHGISYVTSSNSFTKDEWLRMKDLADNLTKPNLRLAV